METSIVRKTYVISLRNGMMAYVVADNLEQIAGALQNNKFFNTKEEMMINTADIVAIMSPSEWENQQRYQRGWYIRGLWWYNKKGEEIEHTELGHRLEAAYRHGSKVQTREDALAFVQKLKDRELYDYFKHYYHVTLRNVETLIDDAPHTIDTSALTNKLSIKE